MVEILLRHSGPILSAVKKTFIDNIGSFVLNAKNSLSLTHTERQGHTMQVYGDA